MANEQAVADHSRTNPKPAALVMEIEWRRVPISPYRRYEVSSDGRVRRGDRELRGDTDSDGYRRVLLSYAGIPKRFKVSRLVCEAFHGAQPFDRAEACHMDGDRSHDFASNLGWATHAENISHKVGHGTVLSGERHPRAILTETTAREAFTSRETAKEIAARLGVSVHAIRDVRERKRWASATAGLVPPDRHGNLGFVSELPPGFAEAAAAKPHWSVLAARFGMSKASVYRNLTKSRNSSKPPSERDHD